VSFGGSLLSKALLIRWRGSSQKLHTVLNETLFLISHIMAGLYPHERTPVARELARVRQKRALLTAEGDVPTTNIGFRHMKVPPISSLQPDQYVEFLDSSFVASQTKLEREEQIAKQRNTELLELIAQSSRNDTVQSTSDQVQVCPRA
jgi:hypothetical protein